MALISMAQSSADHPTDPSKYLWTVLSVTTLGAFMAGLDTRIVVVGLDAVAGALHADIEQALWFTQAYMLGSTLMLLLVGRLADLYGRVRLYLAGFAVFTVGSLLSGLSPNPLLLIASRFVQGLGGGILNTVSAAIVTDAAAYGPLAFALSVNSLAFRLGSILGLTLGGLIIGLFDWRLIFWINVPVGVAAVIWGRRTLREIYKPREQKSMDWLGFALFTVFTFSILLALTFEGYGLSYRKIANAMYALSMASLAGFTLWELRQSHPLLDLRLFKVWSFTGGVVAQFLNAVAFGSVMLLLTLYFEVAKSMSPSETGLLLMPFELSFLAFSLISGKLSDKYGYVGFAILGLFVGSLALLVLSSISLSTPYWQVALGSALLGAGNGLFMSPNTSAIMSSVPEERRGVASALRNVLFNLGMTLSLNISVLLLSSRLSYDLITKLLLGAELDEAQLAAGRSSLALALGEAFRVLALVNLSAAVFSVSRVRGKRVLNFKTPEYGGLTCPGS
ncbi:MFS transporter [Infirmifilum sp. NZ]|uniref:MFS transporter n=1 Tax=Infirmifilum sp. NZ TaxID=2926850 RepID=UPI00279A1E48|nr:MFS transporter [Infirmifilum sp. NZ]UNQ73606.1 MFS transporter [Infirmifilum sp. NZ]